MARARPAYRCDDCGGSSLRWAGRCPACGSWNTLRPDDGGRGRASLGGRGRSGPAGSDPAGFAGCSPAPVLLAEVESEGSQPTPSGLTEFDRVLGGGLVPGSATLIGGEPGIGKSTLLLQALAGLAGSGSRCLLVSAEESPTQVRTRAERMGALVPGLFVVGETSMPGIEDAIDAVGPDVVVVDSVQTVWDPEIDSPPGSLAQVRGCAHRLVAAAKAGGPATLLVGHVTKEGVIAGPRVLEHLVDTVLSFEGERHHALRLLRAVKHRFGSTGELGVFEMTAVGLQPVADPGSMFLADRRGGTPGSVVFPYMEGQRPLMVEVQALVPTANVPTPRRSVAGFDSARLSLLLAVLDRRAGLSLAQREVYVSIAGGVRVADPGADLAVCLAVASAATGRPIDEDLVVLGEVGLAGEVRRVAHTPRRLAEAARLGFGRALVPQGGTEIGPGLAISGARTLVDALDGHLGDPDAGPKLRLLPGSA